MILNKKLNHIPLFYSIMFFETGNIGVSNFLNIYQAISIIVQGKVALYIKIMFLYFPIMFEVDNCIDSYEEVIERVQYYI